MTAIPDWNAVNLLVKMSNRDGAKEPSLLAWLGMCLAIRTVRDGHTCVDLRNITAWGDEFGIVDPSGWTSDTDEWKRNLQSAKALVGTPNDRKPFILDGNRLYLGRAHHEEREVARMVLERLKNGRLRILLGGPGTGKTTTIATELNEQFEQCLKQQSDFPRLALAAPTGKAASRMTEAIREAIQRLQPSEQVKTTLGSTSATTIHKLIRYNPVAFKPYGWNRDNPLPYDLVIIDEASMLSNSLMYHLLSAIAPNATLILVGDPDQLASIDSGTVLSDLADGLLGQQSSDNQIRTLTRIHRAESKTIIELASAIKRNEPDSAFEILSRNDPSVMWADPNDKPAMEKLLKEMADLASDVQRTAEVNPCDVLLRKGAAQVLCAHRKGPMGVAGWNQKIEQLLQVRIGDIWYTGRPLLVTRNNPSLNLYNGDIGIVVRDGDRKAAIFPAEDGNRQVPVSTLEDVVTVHALTIHKSQGSEYQHAVVVLPEKASRITTRELLYTAITRAKGRVTLVGPKEVVRTAIETPIRRATGLSERLAVH
jgi:exodeoxyribonuclease V alpha subunit